MKITVSEALRLKNEITKKISTLTAAFSEKKGRLLYDSEPKLEVSFSTITEDGEVVSNSSGVTSLELEQKLTKLFQISHQINSAIANFNLTSGVSDAARERQLCNTLLSMYDLFNKHSTPSTTTKFEVVGNERKKISVVTRPHLTKDHVDQKIRELKDKIRSLQQVIDVANGQTLDVPFEYVDLDVV